MKIITWNCNMAFRKKAKYILELKPDIVVIQECEHPDKLLFPKDTPKPNEIIWYGDNRSKGLGIFSYSDYKFEVHENYNDALKIIIPISVSNGKKSFNLFGIWASNPEDKDGNYITQVWKAIHYYDDLISNNKTILIGDFNSNTIWDKPRREGNHTTVVDKLKTKNIHSVYHKFYKQKQGKESQATFYLYRHKEKAYHMDYCFASFDFIRKMKNVEIGSHEVWSMHSDHVPIIITF